MPEQSQEPFQTIDIPWPKKGVDDSVPYGKQEPETTPDCLNVWNLDARSNRIRGGTRHGVTRQVGALDGTNPVQCLYQADASTLVVTIPPTNQTIATSSTQSSEATPTPTEQPANSLATGSDYTAVGNGSVVVPAQGAGYYMVVPNAENTSATKSSLLGGTNTYLGSCWRQNGHAVILSAAANSGGSSTLSTALYDSLNDSETTINVASGTVFKTPSGVPLTNFIVKIDDEQVRVSSVSGNSLNVSSRGYNGTQAVSHGANATVLLASTTTLTAEVVSGISAGATSLTVSSAAPFYPAVPFTVQIEEELVRVMSKNGTAFGVSRGYGGTTGAVHPTGRPVVLYGQSTLATALLSGISSSDTSIVVSSTVGLPSGISASKPVCIQIEDETIRISGVSGTTLTVATSGRGYEGTTAAAHSTGVAVTNATTVLTADVWSGITSAATSMKVNSATPFPFLSTATFTLKVGDELIAVAADGFRSSTKAFSSLTRGQYSTSAARQSFGATVIPYASTTSTAICRSGITNSATTLVVGVLTFLPASGTYHIKIGSEVLKVTSTTAATKTLSGITRAQNSTSAAYHQTGATVTLFATSTLSMASGLTATATSIVLANATLFPTAGQFVIQIDNEKILINSRSGNTLTVAAGGRGYQSTVAAAHSNGAAVALMAQGTTTLASTGDAKITVTSTAQFPSTGTFEILVDSEKMTASKTSATVLALSVRGASGTTAADHSSGSTVQLSPVYGSATITDVGDTQIFVSNPDIINDASDRQVIVDGEEMTVTNVNESGTFWTVTRSATPSNHASGAAAAPKVTFNTTLSSATISTSAVVASATTFPGTAPFTIKIDNEQMVVTGISGTTYTVIRGQNGTAIADHAVDATVLLWGSSWSATLADAGTGSLTVANALLLPFAPNSGSVSSLSYPIVVDSETMTITAINSSTNEITVTRTAAQAATHASGAPVQIGFTAASTVTNAGGTTVTVASASSFPSNSVVPFVIQINSEQMNVTAVSGSNFTVQRGHNSTTTGTHPAASAVTQVGSAATQQIQYEVRDQFGAAVKALANLMTVTNGSQIYGMAAQEGGSSNFVWVWTGSLKTLTDTFSGFDPTGTSNTGRECLLKYAIAANGTLSATTALLSATTSGVIANKSSTHSTRLTNGTALAAYAPRHGGLVIVPSGTEAQVVLTETGSYVTADPQFVGTRIVAYGCNTGAKKSEQLVALPSHVYSSGPVVGIPRQLVQTGTRTNGSKFLLTQFIDGPGGTDCSKVVSLRASTFPTGTTAPAAVSTGITGATSTPQVHNSPEAVSLASSDPAAGAAEYTSAAYNPLSNRCCAVRKRLGFGTGSTAQTFAMSYTGTAIGGGLVTQGSPMSGISLEWVAPAPWGWILAGVTADGTTDLVAVDHEFRTTNTDGTAMWTASIGWTDPTSIKFGSNNFVRLVDHTSGTVPATPPKRVEYSDTALSFTERASDVFRLKLGAQPIGDVTVSFTSSDVSVTTVSPSSVTFTRTNWNSPQTVTATGVYSAGSGTRTANITAAISSTADTDYNSIPTLPTVACSVTDADAAVLYGENRTSFMVKEGGTISLPVRLSAEPTSSVVLTFTSPDVAQVTVSPTTLTFTTGNYGTDQRVTITGVSDSVTEGNLTYTIAVTSASSDANYNGPTFNPTDLSVVVEETRQPTARILSRLAVAGGKLFEVTRASSSNTALFSRVGTAAFSTSSIVRAANLGARVFFADGQSQLEFNAATGVLQTFTPRSGLYPFVAGARPKCVETWRERVFWFGLASDPQNWFCSRYQDPDDLNYRNTQDTVNTPQDVNAAQKGSFAAAGLFPGGVLNGIVPYNFDLAIFGGDNGLYQLSGDPGAGAVFDEITSASGVGMAFGRAWCKDPLGQIYFFGRTGGVYRLRLNTPAQIMTDRITSFGVERMMDLDLDAYVPSLIWDQFNQGVHVFLTPYSVTGTAYWWFFDAATEGWFPQRLADSATSLMHPLSACVFDGDQANDRFLVLGGRDGVTRKLDPDATTDDGTSFSSYAVIGPISNPPGKVLLNRFQPDHSGATWGVMTGNTPSLALAASAVSLGSPVNGISTRRRVLGRSMYFKASKSSGVMSVDRVTAEIGTTRN